LPASFKLEQYLVIMMNEHDGEGLSVRMRMLVADIRAQWQDAPPMQRRGNHFRMGVYNPLPDNFAQLVDDAN
jgi:hypothetical protein